MKIIETRAAGIGLGAFGAMPSSPRPQNPIYKQVYFCPVENFNCYPCVWLLRKRRKLSLIRLILCQYVTGKVIIQNSNLFIYLCDQTKAVSF